MEPFRTLDHLGNEYVIEHGNVAIDGPTPVVLWPLALWREHRDQRGRPAYPDWDERCPMCWEKPDDLAAHMQEHDETIYPVSGCD